MGKRQNNVLGAIARSRQRALCAGEFFDATSRLAIYAEAEAAYKSCQVCAGLEQVCLRPGKEDDFWKAFDAAHCDTTSIPDGGCVSSCVLGSSLHPAIRLFVHGVANHQKRVTEAWRKRAITSLRGVEGLEDLEEDQAQSALQEVAQLTAAVRLVSLPPPLLPV